MEFPIQVSHSVHWKTFTITSTEQIKITFYGFFFKDWEEIYLKNHDGVIFNYLFLFL